MPNKNTPFLPSERVWENNGRQVFQVLAPIAPRCQLSLNPWKISQGHFLTFTHCGVQTLPPVISPLREGSPIKGSGLLRTFKSGSLLCREEYAACFLSDISLRPSPVLVLPRKGSFVFTGSGWQRRSRARERGGLQEGWNETCVRSSSGWDCSNREQPVTLQHVKFVLRASYLLHALEVEVDRRSLFSSDSFLI